MTSSPAPRIGVIVVAAGNGTRLAHAEPKAFVELEGTTLLERSLHSVFGMLEAAQVVVVAPESHMGAAREIGQRASGSLTSAVTVVTGGATRHASVEAGLAVLQPEVQIVLVHDSARALTPASVFDAVIAAVDATGEGIVPSLPVVDSIKRIGPGGNVIGIVDRADLAATQTPQAFPRVTLAAAYAVAGHDEFTDDAAVFAAAGNAVRVIPGDPLAFKITTAWDLNRARVLLLESHGAPISAPVAASATRVGLGIDVHAFGEAENLWLAGLHWPGEKELSGHSDGDAVAHALCDALLSAAGLGDIGGIFGTADPEFSNARGEVFVRETVRRLSQAGWVPVHASVQIVGNRPKFAPRRREAEAVLATWLGAPVSLSATTTDGLGFTGRGEGIAALATALIAQKQSL
jgi:2-C-methyl-D-erythritol 4-phosphate cytidylyltransferase/2-C-methyl-D-erythritol 2,4-cyclodiphosphate synthase